MSDMEDIEELTFLPGKTISDNRLDLELDTIRIKKKSKRASYTPIRVPYAT